MERFKGNHLDMLGQVLKKNCVELPEVGEKTFEQRLTTLRAFRNQLTHANAHRKILNFIGCTQDEQNSG